MRLNRALGRNRDLPQLEGINLNAQSGAGSGADYEHAIVCIPDLSKNAVSGGVGDLPINTMQVRYFTLIWEAALTGAATNNFTLNFLQRRAGALLVNTTSSSTVTAGAFTFTPAAMTNIAIGTQLVFSGGTGATETVVVTAITSTTATATFANGHSGAYTITSAPLASITYASGTNDTAYVPRQLTAIANTVKAGDVITVQRVSAGTGLASPACTVGLDWITAGFVS